MLKYCYRKSLLLRQTKAIYECAIMSISHPTSFLKWAGGKRKMMSHFCSAIESLEQFGQRWNVNQNEQYHEPFMGSAAVYLGLKKSQIIHSDAKSFLSDLNQVLVITMKEVQSKRLADLKIILEQFRTEYMSEIDSIGFPKGISKNQREKRYYYLKRNRMNELIRQLSSERILSKSENLELAATMIFLNKTCFNGLWRVSADGYHNVPEGRYAKPLNIFQPEILDECQELLGKAQINNQDFEESFGNVKKGDLVYLDPPYIPLNLDDYVFTSYNSKGFTLEDQKRLAKCAALAVKKGARIMASNNDHPLIREIYLQATEEAGIARPTFRTFPIKRTMNSKGDGRIQVNEILIFMHPKEIQQRYLLTEIHSNQQRCSEFLNELPRNKSFAEVIETAHVLCPELKLFCEEHRAQFEQLKSRDKGSMGKMAEFYIFGQLPNSEPVPDLAWGADIKATHFKHTKDGLNAKERLTITNCGDTNDYTTFSKLMETDTLQTNHHYSKLRKGVLLVFEHQGGTYDTKSQNLQKRLLCLFSYDLEDMPSDVIEQFNADFSDIQEKVRTNSVSQSGQKFIHIAPHGSKGSSTRALCFNNKFVTKLLSIRTGIPLSIKGRSWYIESKHFS